MLGNTSKIGSISKYFHIHAEATLDYLSLQGSRTYIIQCVYENEALDNFIVTHTHFLGSMLH